MVPETVSQKTHIEVSSIFEVMFPKTYAPHIEAKACRTGKKNLSGIQKHPSCRTAGLAAMRWLASRCKRSESQFYACRNLSDASGEGKQVAMKKRRSSPHGRC
jgi:hypothetical protein